jgi:hypothetical protein
MNTSRLVNRAVDGAIVDAVYNNIGEPALTNEDLE